MTKVFLDYDQAALDASYNLRAAVPEAVDCLAECARRSAYTRALKPVRLDVAYGPSHGERANVYPAAKPGAPVLVFIHGGYWQRLDKNDFDYVLDPFLDAGVAAVNVNYTLIPTVTMDEIVRQVRSAIAWAWREAKHFNGDPERLHVAGHSAGAHLTTMAALTDWQGFAPGLPADPIKSATAVSGVYDLEPIRLSAQNAGVKLDAATARRNSPALYVRKAVPPLMLAVGANETPDFIRQQRDFAALMTKLRAPVTAIEIPKRHHFDVTHELADARAELYKSVRAQIGL